MSIKIILWRVFLFAGMVFCLVCEGAHLIDPLEKTFFLSKIPPEVIITIGVNIVILSVLSGRKISYPTPTRRR